MEHDPRQIEMFDSSIELGVMPGFCGWVHLPDPEPKIYDSVVHSGCFGENNDRTLKDCVDRYRFVNQYGGRYPNFESGDYDGA